MKHQKKHHYVLKETLALFYIVIPGTLLRKMLKTGDMSLTTCARSIKLKSVTILWESVLYGVECKCSCLQVTTCIHLVRSNSSWRVSKFNPSFMLRQSSKPQTFRHAIHDIQRVALISSCDRLRTWIKFNLVCDMYHVTYRLYGTVLRSSAYGTIRLVCNSTI